MPTQFIYEALHKNKVPIIKIGFPGISGCRSSALAILEVKSVAAALADLEPDHVRMVAFPGSDTPVSALSEPGVYWLVMREHATSPAARSFYSRIWGKIVPSIIETGCYRDGGRA